MKIVSYKQKAKIVVVSRRNPQKRCVFRCHYALYSDCFFPFLSYRQDSILRNKINDPVVSRYASVSLVPLPSYIESITDPFSFVMRLIKVQ